MRAATCWAVQNRVDINLSADLGVQFDSPCHDRRGRLQPFVNGKAVGHSKPRRSGTLEVLKLQPGDHAAGLFDVPVTPGVANERAAVGGAARPIPDGYRWTDLSKLGQTGGMPGLIFRKAQDKIHDPAELRRLIVELIGKENWLAMSADVKGDACEGLLEKNAQDVKGGAGQYPAPRPLIQALVECIQPRFWLRDE